MKTPMIVVAARHGSDSCGSLTASGRDRISSLIKHLERMIPQGTAVAIFHSSYGRAKESAEMIQGAFQGSVRTEISSLCCDSFEDVTDALKAVEDLGIAADALVYVTHYEAPSGIIDYHLRKNGKPGYNRMVIPKGSALILNADGVVRIG